MLLSPVTITETSVIHHRFYCKNYKCLFKQSNFRTLGHFTKIYLLCVGHDETFLCNYDVE